MQEQRPTTLSEKMTIVAVLASFPALTVMVFLRRKLGYRFIDLMKVQIMVLLLWIAAPFSAIIGGVLSTVLLALFGLAVLAAAYIERGIRWREIKRGISWHTYSRGIPWIGNLLHMPETAGKRFIDPAAVAVIGVLFAVTIARAFGLYLILCAVCLFIFEAWDYDRSINRMLDQLDNLVESEVVSGNVEYFEQGGQKQERPVEQTAGIPTGVSPDLAAAIARRQARNRKQQGASRPLGRDSNATVGQPDPAAASSPVPQASTGLQPPHDQLRRQPQQAEPPDFSFQSEPEEVDPDVAEAMERRRARSRMQTSEELLPPQSPASRATPRVVIDTSGIRPEQSASGIPVIQSPNDPAFAALPSGAEFMTPDGKRRRKN